MLNSPMDSAPELHQLGGGSFVWQKFDPHVKADLFSTGLATAEGVYLIDPMPIDDAALLVAIGDRPVAGVMMTNANHARAVAPFARKFHAAVYTHADSATELPEIPIHRLATGRASLPGLQVIELPGAAPGEIAVHDGANGGTIVIGDALINFGSHGFSLLPAKYCTKPKLLRKSLAQLLDLDFERMLFAHGTPMLSKAHARLGQLLNDNR